MSAITIEGDLVHYEVLGRGRPVIFVHGWLGSWRYWVPTMQQLSMKYRTYALDLWGFGDSGKDPNHYTLSEQVGLLYAFLDRLGIPKAALIGHSLGAAVCLKFARQYPERAHRMMLMSLPLADQGGLSGEIGASAPAPVATTAPAPVANVPANNVVASPPAATPAVTPASGPLPAVPVNTPASAAPGKAEAAPASATPAAAVLSAPSTSTAATAASTNAPPSSTPAPTASGQTPTPAPTPASVAASVPADASSTNETIPRNPFKARGETVEELLARLRAKNAITGGTDSVARPALPVLPTSIAKPIVQDAPAAPAVAAVQAPVQAPRADLVRPLMLALTGTKPTILLSKHVKRDTPELENLRIEVEKADENVFIRSVQSFAELNVAAELRQLATPTLLLHGSEDTLLPPPNDDLLQRINAGKPNGHFLPLVEPALGHFPMLEITAKFIRLLSDFLEAPDLSNVQFKDQWRRTLR